MEIKTKFNIDDDKWFMCSDEPHSGKITRIKVEFSSQSDKPQIIYVMDSDDLNSNVSREEANLFDSKERLFSTVLKRKMDRVSKMFED